ncbi:bifunctional 4-hydroxy-2-oxoglutarate aldolase/2-dehydro-3-deoxy-phosphogluconate aldolase [Agromyces bauzanensis]
MTAGTAATAGTANAAGAESAAGTRTPPLRELLARFGVVPVVAVSSADEGLRLGEALLRGGLPVVEITFRTDAAAAAIRAVAAELPELVVGAGTLLGEASVDAAVDAGAAFGVAPGLRPPVAERAAALGLPFAPGIATPSELELGLSLGLDFFKLFPAEPIGGLRLIDALAGPYPSAGFMPTGGIRPELLADYLARPSVAACGGTWIAPTALIAAGDFDEIRQRTAASVARIGAIRETHRKEHRNGA